MTSEDAMFQLEEHVKVSNRSIAAAADNSLVILLDKMDDAKRAYNS